MKKIILSVLTVLIITSCGNDAAKVKQLQYENDSLVAVSVQTREDFDQLLSTLNEIEDGFDKIKEQENYLVIQSQSNDINKSTKERLLEDIN